MFFEPAGEIRQMREVRGADYFRTQADILEAQILRVIEDDPVAAGMSWLGRNYLKKYGFLLPNALASMGLCICDGDGKLYNLAHGATCSETHTLRAENAYPRQFELGDVLLHGDQITLQLIAEEYLEDAGELSPYTPDVLTVMRPIFADPFASNERPDVTVEGKDETVNLNPLLPPSHAPDYGFREVG